MLKVLFVIMGLVSGCLASPKIVRLPALAGQFYPASPEILKKIIDQYLSNAEEKMASNPSKIIGMIVPHAGYQYAGQTAAYAYSILKNHKFDVIVLIGPYHESRFLGVSIWAEGVWRTPLGEVHTDETLAKSIQNESNYFQYGSQLHITEHSLEVQLPFIQVVGGGAKIVPILISDMRFAKPLAKALYKHLQGRSALVIASTDLSHYHPDTTARDIDKKTQEVIQKASPEAFHKAYASGEIELCGASGVLTLLEFSRLVGKPKVINLHYANSGGQTRDTNNVVGYNASLVVISDDIPLEQSEMLLNFSKDTLFAYLTNKTMPTFLVEDPLLKENRAVFVTLRNKKGDLRGCIGRLEAEEPLYQAVQNMSIEAATKDSRFPPLSLNELKGLLIEISVLSPPMPVKSTNEIVYGTHGVIVSQGKRSGVFLPDVSKDYPTKAEFLAELCFQKAGLPKNCWENPQTRIKVFTTQTIGTK